MGLDKKSGPGRKGGSGQGPDRLNQSGKDGKRPRTILPDKGPQRYGLDKEITSSAPVCDAHTCH